MSIVAVEKSPEQLTMTVTCEYQATPERVWQLWADPRQLERWWGPPTYPATVTLSDFRAGGRVEYHMTGPTGDTPRGYWELDEVDPPRTLAVRDGFAHPDGTPDTTLPGTSMRVTIEPIDAGRTRMTLHSFFPDLESMEKLLAMGAEEGFTQALGQIDALLAERP